MSVFKNLEKTELDQLLSKSEELLRQADNSEMEKLFYELHQHKIELEMQNRELLESQMALEQARDLYADLYDSAPVGYLTLNQAGIIKQINLTAVSMLNQTRQKMLDLPFSHFIGHEHRRGILGFINKVCSSQQTSNYDFPFTHNEELRYFRLQAQVDVKSEDCRAVLLDVTEIIKAEEIKHKHNELLEHEILERTEELADSVKKAEKANMAKSEFLAKMSHELRTPMHAILSFASLGLKRVEDQKLEHYLQNIRTSGIRLVTLLNDLLDLSRLESNKVSIDLIEQDITVLISHAVEEVSSLLQEKNLSVELDIEKSVSCMVDHKLLIQVMVNLLSNAIKFSPPGSTITVTVNAVEQQHHGRLLDAVNVAVIDHGIGIPADEVELIFDNFVQGRMTQASGGGTGLGLPISKEIIELHNGKIWVDSPPPGQSEGSAFCFWIPMIHEEGNDLDLHEIIESHEKWREIIDAVLTGKNVSAVPAAMMQNKHLCSLGKWLDSKAPDAGEYLELNEIHGKFHHLAGQILELYQTNHAEQAQQLMKEFDDTSNSIVDLLTRLKEY